MCERGQISGAAVALNAQREHRGLRDVHAFSSESIPPRGLSLTHLAGKGLLVACHGHEAEKLAGMARIYIYPEPDLRPAYSRSALGAHGVGAARPRRHRRAWSPTRAPRSAPTVLRLVRRWCRDCTARSGHPKATWPPKLVTTVGFEPTPLARPAPKAGALDHSATLSASTKQRCF